MVYWTTMETQQLCEEYSTSEAHPRSSDPSIIRVVLGLHKKTLNTVYVIGQLVVGKNQIPDNPQAFVNVLLTESVGGVP